MFALALPSYKSVFKPNSIESTASASKVLKTNGSTSGEVNKKAALSSACVVYPYVKFVPPGLDPEVKDA